MSDLNIFLSAIQSAFNTAVKAAVEEATAPLVQRIAVLEQSSSLDKMRLDATAESIAALGQRITTLENNPAQGVDTTVLTATAFATELRQIKERVITLESRSDDECLTRGDVESLITQAVEEAMEEHTSNYDHDDYDSHISDDDKHFEGDIEDAVRDALSNMTFDVSIR